MTILGIISSGRHSKYYLASYNTSFPSGGSVDYALGTINVSPNGDLYYGTTNLWFRTDKAGTVKDSDNLVVSGIVTDSSNNVYMSAIDTTYSAHVIKYDSSGNIVWQNRRQEYWDVTPVPWPAYDIGLDSTGNVYAVGNRYMGTNISALVKYNSSGVQQWTQDMAYAVAIGAGCRAHKLAIDSSDNIHVVGHYIDSGYSYYGLYSKFNTSGTESLKIQYYIPASTYTYIKNIAIDSSGNPYIVGFMGSATSGFIAKLDSSGNITWTRTVSFAVRDVYFDSSNNVYAIGDDGVNVVIFKYNSSGTLQWQRSISQSGADNGYAVTINSTGDIAIFAGNQSNTKGLAALLPSDGSKTGTYTISGSTYTYAASSYTDSAGTLAKNSPAPYSTSSASYTYVAGTRTKTTQSITSSIVNL